MTDASPEAQDQPQPSTDAQSQGQSQTQANPQPQAQNQSSTQPSEEELRAAYEAELNRITSADLLLQTAASLLNLGARRLGLTGAGEAERDLEQVRDAIDGVRALMPILERCHPSEVGPLRDALSQLQMAYAREVQATREPPAAAPGAAKPTPSEPTSPAQKQAPGTEGEKPAPGPAESSGRLWVPGR
jgi:phage-related minor tail protein